MSAALADRAVGLYGLYHLRWLMLGAAALAVVLVQATVGGLPWAALLGLLGVGVASNLALRRWLGAPGSDLPALAVLGFDLLGLTLLLAASGGAHNPFAFLYLLLVAFGALVLPVRAALGLAVAGAGAYASLFLIEPPHLHDPGAMQDHLFGMWVAYGVSAAVMVVAVARLRGALTAAEARAAADRAARERADRLASLATLAAGAAHELASPLGTIAVVATELGRVADEGVRADAALLTRSVDRCRAVLQQLAVDSGAGFGELPRPMRVAELVEAALAGCAVRHRVEVGLGEAGDARVTVPPGLLAQAVRRLIQNAVQASPDDAPVRLVVRAGDGVDLAVIDAGAGMAPEVLARAGEPFFTTRETGQGMGLGLFFARTVTEHAGGRLELTSSPGGGTTARLWLPLAPEDR